MFTVKGITLEEGKASLNQALHVAAPNVETENEYRKKVGLGVQEALKQQFRKYDLTGKTWAALTKAEEHSGAGADLTEYVDEGGVGPLKRGAAVYKTLV